MRFLKYLLASLFLIVAMFGCGSSSDSAPLTDDELLDKRPFEMKIPASYDTATPTPLVVVLHGFGGNGAQISSYWRLTSAAERHGFLLAMPDGIPDLNARRHWNGTDACCAPRNSDNDDVRYLSLVLDDIEAGFNVDDKQIFFIGHSNGAFMSHRMACDLSDRVAAIVALAGVSWNDIDKCQTDEPVNVLQVHGDLDNAILFGGGVYRGAIYPSAIKTITDWAGLNGCGGPLIDNPPNLNIDTSISGSETRVQHFVDCPLGGAAELWTILGGGHVPGFDDNWADAIWTFLSSHPKP